jgi:H+-translocating NAD(P) transhydrogenase subunit alpha
VLPAAVILLGYCCVAHLYCNNIIICLNLSLPFRGTGGIMDNLFTWISGNQQIIYIVILMIFVGIEVIGRVPSVLHTPLMSGANAIHGVVIIGAIIVMGRAESNNYFALILGFLAVILGTLNVVGGFVVTDRMLEMFKSKKKGTK